MSVQSILGVHTTHLLSNATVANGLGLSAAGSSRRTLGCGRFKSNIGTNLGKRSLANERKELLEKALVS